MRNLRRVLLAAGVAALLVGVATGPIQAAYPPASASPCSWMVWDNHFSYVTFYSTYLGSNDTLVDDLVTWAYAQPVGGSWQTCGNFQYENLLYMQHGTPISTNGYDNEMQAAVCTNPVWSGKGSPNSGVFWSPVLTYPPFCGESAANVGPYDYTHVYTPYYLDGQSYLYAGRIAF